MQAIIINSHTGDGEKEGNDAGGAASSFEITGAAAVARGSWLHGNGVQLQLQMIIKTFELRLLFRWAALKKLFVLPVFSSP